MSFKSLFWVISVTFSVIFFTTENVKAISECEMALRDFGYDGYLHHDLYYFEVGTDLKPNPWLPRYRAFIDYVRHKIFSTESNMMEIHCKNVELLFGQGYTGVLQIDQLLTENKYNQQVVTNYLNFLNIPFYSKRDTNEKQFVFDMVYEFAVMTKFRGTEEGRDCSLTLSSVGYVGNFKDDVKHKKSTGGEFPEDQVIQKDYKYIPDYNSFLDYTKPYVLFTDVNSVKVFCHILAPLATYGCDGTKKTDLPLLKKLEETTEHGLKEEAKIYEHYLKRVKEEIYEAADVRCPLNFLAQLGLHKLGKIMY